MTGTMEMPAADHEKIHIRIFNNYWVDCSSLCDADSLPKNESYFGLWEKSNSVKKDSKEVFQDFQIWLGWDDNEKRCLEELKILMFQLVIDWLILVLRT